jgi:glycosyltransferase involved in cell wall biosynthesis
VKVAHLITGLYTGGAETMLLKLVRTHRRMGVEMEVISILEAGTLVPEFQALGVPVHCLGIGQGSPDPRGLVRLLGHLSRFQPDVLQTWMYHADLLGAAAKVFRPRMPLVWNIRHSNLDAGLNRAMTLRIARLSARLSRALPRRIICCSEASREVHAAIGYDAGRMTVIPNGFDLGLFRPDPAARAAVRQSLGIPEEALLVGVVARLDPIKDHGNFFAAWRRLPAEIGGRPLHALLCGTGMTVEEPRVAEWTRGLDHSRLHLLGLRKDVPALDASLDIACSSSVGEGFPNVLGEAMACGVPCVVTDVGDSASIVADTGRVVPPSDPGALAQELLAVLNLPPEGRRALGMAALQRVQQNYKLEIVSQKYLDVYTTVLR